MLSQQEQLHFPTLTYERKVNFKSWSSNKETSIFSLNWSKFDAVLFQEYHKRVKYSSTITSLQRALPEKWDKWLNKFQFAIPENYLNEIYRCSRLGQVEWGRTLPFDTNIREMCMETGETSIKVAFKLIADCAYDSEKNYFYRGIDKYILDNVMRYKFWCHQTGRGLIWEKAGFHGMENRLETLTRVDVNKAMVEIYKTILADFGKHETIAYTVDKDNVEEKEL